MLVGAISYQNCLSTYQTSIICHLCQLDSRIRQEAAWSGVPIRPRPKVTEQLRQNYLVSRGISPSSHTATTKNPLPSQGDSRGSSANIQRPMADAGGATDTNREWELNGNMDMSVDDEEAA